MKFKELLKNKKLVGGAAVVLVAAIAVTAVLLMPRGGTPPETDPGPENSTVSVQPPSVSTLEPNGSEPEPESTATGENPEVSDVKVELEQPTPDVPGKPSGSGNGDSGKAEQPAKPVTPVEPEQPGNEGGVQIGGGDTPVKYNCGAKNHHCQGPETHAFIQNLELEGCERCGSHSCPSFYGTDQWGGGGLFPELCPKYNEKNDPLKYCQDCGKKPGDGSSGTCAQFISDIDCPLCGKHVEAWTCHTCK